MLPPASKDLLPYCYHDLMMKENSLLKKYYPENFQTDLNGKKQEWEAVVLVPFIDEVGIFFYFATIRFVFVVDSFVVVYLIVTFLK